MFFALKGDNFNGNLYANEALKKGAKYAIVDDKKHANSSNIILVENVLKSLQKLASFHRSYLNIPIIALTGSNGKTTTKELINAVLSKKFKTTATLGNLNNHIGVPLTLLNLNEQHQIAIIEMGANHLKEIEFLCNIANPNFGLITNIGKAHIGEFGGYDNIVKAKTELLQFLLKNKGFAFINADQEEILNFATKFDFNKKITYGQSPFADEVAIPNKESFFCQLLHLNKNYKSKLIGTYNFSNILAAISIGKYFKVNDEKIKDAIENYEPKNNRSEFIETQNNKIILDAYNANPSSVKVALDNFEKLDENNKVIILGQMNELGKFAKQEHQNVMDKVTKINNLHQAIFIGKNFNSSFTNSKFLYFEKTEELKNHLQKNIIKTSFVLIKGSRTNNLETLIEYL